MYISALVLFTTLAFYCGRFTVRKLNARQNLANAALTLLLVTVFADKLASDNTDNDGSTLPPLAGTSFPHAVQSYISPFNSYERRRAIDTFVDRHLGSQPQVHAFLDRATEMIAASGESKYE